MKFQGLFLQVHQLIQQGQVAQAQSMLLPIAPGSLPRQQRLPFANLCRRASLPKLGLQALAPILRPGPKKPLLATHEEKIEYGFCLNWLGLVSEAKATVEKVPYLQFPHVLLLQSFLEISQWNYEEAAPKLELYLKTQPTPNYERDIVNTNYLAVLVHLKKFSQATPLLEQLKHRFQELGLGNLYINALKQELEMRILQGNHKKSTATVKELEQKISNTDNFSQLYIRKWLAIEKLLQNPKDKKSWLTDLHKVRSFANKIAHFETLRECDYFEAEYDRNELLAAKVLYGTPFAPYRKRILESSSWVKLENLPGITVQWTSESPTITSVNHHNSENEFPLETGLPEKLILFLQSDFYAKASVPKIFNHLFPQSYFIEPYSSNTVHQQLHRSRAHLKKVDPNLRVVEKGGFYRLKGEFKLSPDQLFKLSISKKQQNWLVNKWSNMPFSAQDFQKTTSLPLRTCQRHLGELVKQNQLCTIRNGKNIFYSTLTNQLSSV